MYDILLLLMDCFPFHSPAQDSLHACISIPRLTTSPTRLFSDTLSITDGPEEPTESPKCRVFVLLFRKHDSACIYSWSITACDPTVWETTTIIYDYHLLRHTLHGSACIYSWSITACDPTVWETTTIIYDYHLLRHTLHGSACIYSWSITACGPTVWETTTIIFFATLFTAVHVFTAEISLLVARLCGKLRLSSTTIIFFATLFTEVLLLQLVARTLQLRDLVTSVTRSRVTEQSHYHCACVGYCSRVKRWCKRVRALHDITKKKS